MADILTMKGVAIAAPDEAVIDIVEELENLLAQAKSGNIRAFAGCTVVRDGSVTTTWAGAHGTRYPLGGVIAMLHHRYTMRMIED